MSEHNYEAGASERLDAGQGAYLPHGSLQWHASAGSFRPNQFQQLAIPQYHVQHPQLQTQQNSYAEQEGFRGQVVGQGSSAAVKNEPPNNDGDDDYDSDDPQKNTGQGSRAK